MLNQYIAAYKRNDENSNDAFKKIYYMCRPYINSMAKKYPIKGKDIDDFHYFAMEQILDCLTERKLKRGKGIKKTLSEDNDANKNFSYLIASIKYKFLRELRKTEANIKYSFNMPILDENGKQYLDRNNKPLDIGINFIHNVAHLFEGKKNLRVVLNLPVIKNSRTVVNFDYANPLDCAISYDLKTGDEDDCNEIKNIIDYECKSVDDANCSTIIEKIDLDNIPNIIKGTLKLDDVQFKTIVGVIENSYSTIALKQYVKENRKNDR